MINQAEFEQAYTNHYPRTHRFLLSRGIAPTTAEEVAQAAWSKGWERREDLREAGKIGAWVNTIALNLLRRRIRQDKRTTELQQNMDSPTELTVSDRVDAEKLLGEISEQDRDLLLMHVVEGRTSREISESCSLSPVAVRVRLSRAKARLRARFTDRPTCRPIGEEPVAAPVPVKRRAKTNCKPRHTARAH